MKTKQYLMSFEEIKAINELRYMMNMQIRKSKITMHIFNKDSHNGYYFIENFHESLTDYNLN